MTYAESRKVYNSKRWQRTRAIVRKRANWRCEECGRTALVQAHHIRPMCEGGDPFSLDNLIGLCVRCHRTAHPRNKPKVNDGWAPAVKALI